MIMVLTPIPTPNDNTLNIVTGADVNGTAYGGYTITNNYAVANNTVTISDGTVIQNVYGGGSNDGNATGNKIEINGGTIQGVYGGRSRTGHVTDNTVKITGGIIERVVYGGYVTQSAGSATATENVVEIRSGTVGGNVSAAITRRVAISRATALPSAAARC